MKMNHIFKDRPQILQEEVDTALNTACDQIFKNLSKFTYSCQNYSSVDLFYPTCDNNQWTCGFWPGEIWLAFEHTQKPVYKYGI